MFLINLYSDLGNVRLIPEGSGATTQYYAQLGADAASKKLLGSTVVKLGSGSSYNLTSYAGYKNFTIANFLLDVKSISGNGNYDGYVGGQFHINKGGGASASPSKSYNPTTGILTISGLSGSSERRASDSGDGWSYNGTERGSCSAKVDVYLIY